MAKPNSEFIEYILELLESAGEISSCRMFGGYAIRKNGLAIALIFQDEIYFKVDKINKPDYEKIDSKPFTYEARGKIIEISNWSVPIEILEDPDQLMIWVDKAYSVAKRRKR